MRQLRLLAFVPLMLLLGGCNVVLMAPSGDIAVQQRNLLLASTGLMLIIILPVMVLTALFAWHYRASNKEARYDPDWHHSTALEVVIWSAPLLIIIVLGALTWMGTHLLDPYRPISRISRDRSVPEGVKPLTVEVVALDWKWLFFYPDLGIATVNELAAPVDVPLQFRITGTTVMNAFFVPTLAGMIYAMPGMETKLHAVINRTGVFEGMSSHYSGAGFSRMTFKFHGLSQSDFDGWVAKAKGSGQTLDRPAYADLEKPSEAEPVRYYGTVDSGLFDAILNMCARPGKMCMNEMMRIDARGGSEHDHETNHERLKYDRERRDEREEAPGATFPASGRAPREGAEPGKGGSTPPNSDGGGHGGHGGAPNPNGGPAPTQLNR